LGRIPIDAQHFVMVGHVRYVSFVVVMMY
jgi:hypothetical protein